MATADSEPTPAPPAEPTEGLPLDVVFGLLSNSRRRLVLRYLMEESDSATVSDLAEHVAAVETGKSPEALKSAERKRAYVGIYQCHLPKLDDAEVVDFDGRDRIELADGAEELAPYLAMGSDDAGPEQDRPSQTDAGLLLGGSSVGVVGILGVLHLGAGLGVALAATLALVVAVALN